MYKKLCFGLLAVVIVMMIIATVVEHRLGTPFALTHFYTAPWMLALWAATATSGLIHLFRSKPQLPVVLIHCALVLILIGALVSHCTTSQNPWGVRVSFTAYGLLFASFLWLLIQRGRQIRHLLSFLLFSLTLQTQATEPQVLQSTLAKHYGQLYTTHNERICPVNTLATDFTTKLCGKPSYNGYSADQVLTGFIFYYDDWKKQPIIRVKGDHVRKALGIQGRYAALTDFYRNGSYLLQPLIDQGDRKALAADEKVQLIATVATGAIFRDDPFFHFEEQNAMAAAIYEGHNRDADRLIRQQIHQQEKLALQAKSRPHIRAEILYNQLHLTGLISYLLTGLGLLLLMLNLFQFSVLQKARLQKATGPLHIMLTAIVLIYLTMLFALRWTIAGHVPLASGYETMQFLALTVLGYGLVRRSKPAYIYLLAGLAMLVSRMGESDPQVTPLVPALQSPLLSVHVCVIMLAYCLLAYQALESFVCLLRPSQSAANGISVRSAYRLLWAVALLAIGIFLGAIWANSAWGTYWNWDPKETWALITLLIYALPLHRASLPFFRRPRFFYAYTLVAFCSVLFTYLGVNFLLGGLHSYV